MSKTPDEIDDMNRTAALDRALAKLVGKAFWQGAVWGLIIGLIIGALFL